MGFIDSFAKAKNHKRELPDDQLQYGQQECLADALHARLHLPLAHLVNAGDVIHPLDAVQIALVDGVDAYKTSPPSGRGALRVPMELHAGWVLVKVTRKAR